MFINDKFKNGKTSKQEDTVVSNLKNTKIGNNVLIAPIQQFYLLNDNVVIGAGAVVTKNINKPGVYFGNPAKYKKFRLTIMKFALVDMVIGDQILQEL